jgi:TonB-linked SusC/RagA family outer membrane protein
MKSKYYRLKVCGLILSILSICQLLAAQGLRDTIRGPLASVDSLRGDSLGAVGYGTQSLKTSVSAISRVPGKSLRYFFNTNTVNKLFGRLPGLTVSQNGTEDGDNGPGLDYRGKNTFGTGTNVLIVLDGFIVDANQFAKLSSEEIESVSLLKDAAATAIYGSRGANGVLLVTTMRGKDSPLKIAFSTQNGFSSPTNLPKYLNSYDYARLYNEAATNDGKALRYTDTDLASYQNQSNSFLYPNVNWYDEVLRKSAPVSNYNLNFSGGSNNLKYFVLLGALNTQGLYKNFGDESDRSINSRYHRYNFRANVDVNVTKRFLASLTLNGSVEDKSNPASINTSGTFGLLANLPPNAFPVYNPDGSFGGTNALSNPVGNLLNNGAYTTNGRTLQTTFKVTQLLDLLTEGLSVSGAVSFNNYFVTSETKSNTYQRYTISQQNPDGTYSYSSPWGTPTNPVVNISDGSPDQYRNYAVQSSLNYARVFDKHDVSALLIFNADNINLRSNNTGDGSDPYKHNSVGGRLTYINSSKYIVEFSGAYMGSNIFADGKRYGFFPAGAVGWVLSEENFLKENRVVNFLKLRSSYGLVGNDNIGGSRYAFDQKYIVGGLAGDTYFGSASNTQFVGLEAGLFKRFNMTFDYFSHRRYDILAEPNIDLPLYIGVIRSSYNVGKVDNKGFELSLQYSSNKSKAFQYLIEPSVWYAKNKIVYNSEAVQPFEYLTRTGRIIGEPRQLEALGLFTQAEIDEFNAKRLANQASFAVPANYIPQAGDIKYKDQNGDNVINDNDRYPIGNPDLPKLSAGLHSGFKFKGFDLDLFFQGVSGRTINLGSNSAYFYAFQNNGKVSEIALNRWTPASATTASYPRLSLTDNTNNFLGSSFWNRSGDFIKLRSAELGYSISSRLSKKVNLQSARIYLNGSNLFSIDDFEYGDPETFSGYPVLRTLSLGTRIQF